MAETYPLSKALSQVLSNRDLELVTALTTEAFVDLADVVSNASWPEFMLHDTVANSNWYPMHGKFPEFQFALVHKGSKKWIAVGNSIPIYFAGELEKLPDKGWDWAVLNGMEASQPANLLCALAIQILPEYRGSGLSTIMIRLMREIGMSHGLNRLVAPVRPNRKSDYPLIPMEVYVAWSKEDQVFDPWLRVHHRLGARMLKICPEAMRISGTIKEWQEWTGLSLQSSGDYIVPGALAPVKIDIENDCGVYIEANVWMLHDNNE